MPVKYSTEERAKAVRLVVDHRDDYASEWEAIRKVASRLGVSTEKLRRWVRQAEVDGGQVEGSTSQDREDVRKLKRKVAEQEKDLAFLGKAAAYVGDRCRVPVVSTRLRRVLRIAWRACWRWRVGLNSMV